MVRETYGPDRQTLRPRQEDPFGALQDGAAEGGDPHRQAARPAVQADRGDRGREAEDLPAGGDAEVAGAAQGAGAAVRTQGAGTGDGRAGAEPAVEGVDDGQPAANRAGGTAVGQGARPPQR